MEVPRDSFPSVMAEGELAPTVPESGAERVDAQERHAEDVTEEPQVKRQRFEAPPVPDNEQLRRRVAYVPANEPVLLRLPSGMTKQVVLTPGKSVSIGKFGTFPADQIIGRAFGPTYEIKADGSLEVMHQDVAEALGTLRR